VKAGLGFIFDKDNIGFARAMLKLFGETNCMDVPITVHFSPSGEHLPANKIAASPGTVKMYITPAMVVRYPYLVFVPIVLAQETRPFHCIEVSSSLALSGRTYQSERSMITLYRTHAPADVLGINNV
jgi:hypothetical protein